jgi:DNA-nicking Smr family endonuclease
MTRKPKPLTAQPGRRALRHLSDEDEALWQRVSQSIDRLPPSKSRGRIAVRPTPAKDGGRPAAEPLAAAVQCRSFSPSDGNDDRRPVSAHEPPPLSPFDRKRARALATGRIVIEAKLDLHGLRQDEALFRLRRFLAECQEHGLSSVLVVTGKGGVRPASRPEEFAFADGERGVLRRNVPLWLEQPELRSIVAGFTQAGVRHGGQGAFYIHLRRRRRD